MNPIVIDPETYDFDEALAVASQLVGEFVHANKLPVPHLLPVRAPSVDGKTKGPRSRGWTDSKTITFCQGVRPARNPGYSWSFPGYKADLTAYGIAAHECGHWFHIHRKGTLKLWSGLERINDVRVSSYEPNGHEAFAESTRLFILNPDLLKRAAPRRYNGLLEAGMVQLHDAPWQEVLKHAGPKRIAAMAKWTGS